MLERHKLSVCNVTCFPPLFRDSAISWGCLTLFAYFLNAKIYTTTIHIHLDHHLQYLGVDTAIFAGNIKRCRTVLTLSTEEKNPDSPTIMNTSTPVTRCSLDMQQRILNKLTQCSCTIHHMSLSTHKQDHTVYTGEVY